MTNGGKTASFNMRYLPGDEEVEIYVDMPENSWLGFVLGASGMASGSDMIVIENGSGYTTVTDLTSEGYREPTPDVTNNIYDKAETDVDSNSDGGVTYTFKRRLDTYDSDDYVLPLDNSFRLGWAFHPSSASDSSKHRTAGSTSITLRSDGSPVRGTFPTDDADS